MKVEIEIIRPFYDAKNKKVLREVGTVIKVTEIRAMELIEKGFAKRVD